MLASTKDMGIQVALTNAGEIRADIGSGELTMQGLMEVLPFGNLVATFEIKGADLWQVFDHGLSQTEVYISDRMGSWNPMDPNAIYKVAANNYIRGGGDDFQVLKEKAIDPYDAGALDLDVVTEFLKVNSPINYSIEGRILQVSK